MTNSISRLLLSTVPFSLFATSSEAQSMCPPGAGFALRFDGANDRVDCSNVWSPSNGQHTIEAWVRVPSGAPGAQATIAGQIGNQSNSCGTGFGLRFEGSRVFYDLDQSSCGGAGKHVYDNGTEFDVWHHYAGTWDASVMRLYRDGLLINQANYSGGFGGFSRFSIGAQRSLFSGHQDWVGDFTGDVDEVRLWNHVRTDAEIADGVDMIMVGNEPGLIGCWRLDEGGTTTTSDCVGSHNGSIGGAQWITASCIGVNYCTASASSVGRWASASMVGSTSLSTNDLTLFARPVPNEIFVFFHGPTQAQLPFGNGFLCVIGGHTRVLPPGVATGNVAASSVDLASAGISTPGAYNFQCWYRDTAGGGAQFNTSDGISVVFVP